MATSITLKRLLALAAISSASFMTTGCENKGEANLASAQTCLDAASTTAEANACAAQTSGDYSTQAYLIRCSANFIAQGVTGDRLATAYKQMDSTSSSNKTTAMMSYLIFDSRLTGNTADDTVLNCQLSGVSSMYQLAHAASLASALASAVLQLGGVADISALLPDASGNIDPDALQNALTTLKANIDANSDPTTIASVESSLGTAVQNSYSAFCATDSSFSKDDVCTKISSAVSAGSTSTEIGAQIVALLQSGN